MVSNKKIILISTLILSTSLSVGCSSSKSDNKTVEEKKPVQSFSNNVNFIDDKNSIYGEITEKNKENITISLGANNENYKDSKIEESDIVDESSENNSNSEDGIIEEPLEIISLNGKKRVITISNDIIISKSSFKISNSKDENSNNQLTISDLRLGDIIKVNYNQDSTKIESIELVSSSAKEYNDDTTTVDSNTSEEVAVG